MALKLTENGKIQSDEQLPAVWCIPPTNRARWKIDELMKRSAHIQGMKKVPPKYQDRREEKMRQNRPAFYFHPSFIDNRAQRTFLSSYIPSTDDSQDDRTREYAKRMHYAAFKRELSGEYKDIENKRWKDRFIEMRNCIATENFPLTFQILKSLLLAPEAKIERDDWAAEASVILLKAAQYFDAWQRNNNFCTFACNSMLQSLRSEVMQRVEELRREQAYEMFDDTEHPVTNWELIEDRRPEPSSVVMEKERAETAQKMLNILPPREKEIIIGRIVDDKTLREVGHRLRITKERTRQLQLRAVQKLQERYSPQSVS